MGDQAMARWQVVALVAVLCASAHSFEEVSDIPASLHEAGMDDDETVAAANMALREYSDALVQVGEESPKVLALTKQIKAQTEEINAIKKKKAVGGKHDNAMKNHIAAGAEDKNLDAVLAKKHHELAQMTLDQHAAAKQAAMGNHQFAHPTGNKNGAGFGGDAFGANAGGAIGDRSHLFDNWLSKYSTMKSNLAKMVEKLKAHTASLTSEVAKHTAEVTNHMGVVKKAYVSIAKKEAAAKAAEKATKEKMSKAVEKKTKAVEAEERKKKMYEKQVEELMKGRAEERAKKEEIKRLKALNAKIKADCERNMKEKTQKIQAAQVKIKKLTQALQEAQARIAELTKALEAQKRETAKQTALKISHEKARKAAEEKLRKAMERIQTLEKELAAVKAKYNKLRNAMNSINKQSHGSNFNAKK